MTLFVVGISAFVLSAIAFTVALGLWTYSDAKVKSDDSAALWTLIILLTGLTGLIIYLIAGRKKPERSPGKFKNFLIASIVCFCFSIPLYIAGIVKFVMGI